MNRLAEVVKPRKTRPFHIFFCGKGGVGKTTCSAATALWLSKVGYKVLLVSLDPAAHLSDVFEHTLTDEPRLIEENLRAAEIDLDKATKLHLGEIIDALRKTYKYLSTLNLEKYLDLLKYSPGVEEDAMLGYVRKLMKLKNYDVVIYDTAPTGLTLRVLALPTIASIWLEKLTSLRARILDLRTTIARVKGERLEAKDAVLNELINYGSEIDEVRKTFSNQEQAVVVMVLTPEKLPLVETERAVNSIRKIGMNVKALIVNQVFKVSGTASPEIEGKIKSQDSYLKAIREEFKDLVMKEMHLQSYEVKGREAIEKFGRELFS